MNITGVESVSYKDALRKKAEGEEVKTESKTKENESTVQRRDTFVKESGTTTSGVYGRNRTDGNQVSTLMEQHQQRIESFRRLLTSMITKQGEKSNLSLFGLDLTVTPEDGARAAAAIAPGGEYSVDAVATRIMDMAKALCGGDASKIGVLRDAVEKGFKAAGVELGGKLPGICNDTYDEIMKRFDEWEREMSGASLE